MNAFHGSQHGSIAPSIGIAGCLREYQQMRAGSVYWLSMNRHVDALRLSAQVLAELDFNNRAVVVACNKVSAIISALKKDQGPADLRVYTFKRDVRTAILHLTEQLDRKLKPIKRLIVCLLPIESMSFLEKDTQPVLKGWRDWCESNGCTLLILAYGEQAQHMSQSLASESSFLSGVGHLKTQENDYSYQIDYWINNLGVQGAQYFILQDKDTGFELLKTAALPEKNVPGEVFLQRSVLEGAPIFMAEKWRIAEDWQELVNTAKTAVSGIFVFALSSNNEFETLARTLYELRQQRGAAVSLVVREMEQVLRDQEVQLLLQCGAILVVSADTHLARFFSMLESLKDRQNSLPLVQDLESAIAKVKASDIKGVVSVLEFTTYVKSVLASGSLVDPGGILVAVRPAPALTMKQMIGQLRIDRKGDVVCVVNGIVYLFLFGCQRDFIEIALQRVFSLPIQDIVSEHQVHTDYVVIEDHMRRMQILNKDKTNFSLDETSESGAATHLVPSNTEQDRCAAILFKPRLKPLQLYSQTK